MNPVAFCPARAVAVPTERSAACAQLTEPASIGTLRSNRTSPLVLISIAPPRLAIIEPCGAGNRACSRLSGGFVLGARAAARVQSALAPTWIRRSRRVLFAVGRSPRRVLRSGAGASEIRVPANRPKLVYCNLNALGQNPILRCAAPGILVAALCLLPFLGKAFTIDDPYFLTEAQQALRTPRTPAAVSLCWDNIGFARPMRDVGSVSVIMGYVLLPVVLLPAKEYVGHLL